MAGATVITVLGLVAACSEPAPKKEYAVPKALCGVPVNPGLLSPFLPAGNTVKVGESRPVPSRKMCRVDVDGTWAVMADLQWWEDDVDVSTVVTANPETEKSAQSTDDDFFYASTGAVKLVKGCKNPVHARHLLYTSIQVNDSDLGDTAAMKNLSAAFTDAVKRSRECS
ncbi:MULTISPECIES: hypothetical protein [Streptomyces]|uniref:hypothetical protein n=1 Tax=Streptomyces TaxID=1883 RepID=UPI0016748654|nr:MULTISPECIES: hypothetical protein [Streptomyces]MBK3520877.1 hypothetical protein [Streptomyces sp. MBT70]GGR99210.1 hypothetical protein GCM10010236_62480 [Streptomyces eurythermus]